MFLAPIGGMPAGRGPTTLLRRGGSGVPGKAFPLSRPRPAARDVPFGEDLLGDLLDRYLAAVDCYDREVEALHPIDEDRRRGMLARRGVALVLDAVDGNELGALDDERLGHGAGAMSGRSSAIAWASSPALRSATSRPQASAEALASLRQYSRG